MRSVPAPRHIPRLRARVLLAAGAAVALATASCDDSSGPNQSISRVEVNLASPTILVGTNAAATARAFDLSGVEVTSFKASWRSSEVGIITVSSTGILAAKSLGTATITATVGGTSGSATITVVPLPVVSIAISPSGGTMDRGQSLQLRATLRDQFGDILDDRPVAWTSSAPGVALVTASGLVNATAAGTAVVTASAEGLSESVTITVAVTPTPTGPSISTISSPLLLPGEVVTITGANFGATPGENEVRVAGVVATVLTASATELTVQLGATGYGCEPTRNVFVQVARGSEADAKAHPLQALPIRTLAVGESVVFTSLAEARCFELEATGGRYAISVFNTGTTTADDAGLRLRGTLGLAPLGVMADAVRASAPSPTRAMSPRVSAPAELRGILDRERQRAEHSAHERILEANLARAHSTSPTPPVAAGRWGVVAAAIANQPIGTIVPMKIPNVGAFLTSGTDFCVDHFAVNARVAYNGQRAVLLEDTGAPFAGQMDTTYARIGQEFDEVMFNIVRDNFADPLRMDDLLDRNGKILMLFSQRINSFSGVAGFVVTCDFEVAAPKASSNRAEVFYAIVPTTTGIDPGSSSTISGWYRTIRSTIVHETKHIAAFSNRIRDFGGSVEESWLEEGTARIVEELWSRTAAYGNLQQNGNATYLSTLFCDVRPSSAPQCLGKPYAMVRHFEQNGLYDFLKETDLRSPLGAKAGLSEGSFYGSSWSLVRWSLDQFFVGEPVMLQPLTKTAQRGVANLVARVGRPWEEMLGEWSLALYTDDRPNFTPLNPRLRFPSWNLRSVYAGLSQDFPVQFNPAFPLVPRAQAYGDFLATVLKVTRGGFAMFELSGAQTGRQLIQLQGLTTTEPGARLRVAVVRLE